MHDHDELREVAVRFYDAVNAVLSGDAAPKTSQLDSKEI